LQSKIGFGRSVSKKEVVINFGVCPLCKRALELFTHLFIDCRYTIHLWALIKDWLGLRDLHFKQWLERTIASWWFKMSYASTPTPKSLGVNC
jgi:hypothetical protein